MTQEEKDLLIKDLCLRLPYGVKCEANTHIELLDSVYPFEYTVNFNFLNFDVDEIKPYLRSMDSMTESEKLEFQNKCIEATVLCYTNDATQFIPSYQAIEWLLENHFDFNNLISLGLAIEVTPENNPYNL